jgi:hypothetical protein
MSLKKVIVIGFLYYILSLGTIGWGLSSYSDKLDAFHRRFLITVITVSFVTIFTSFFLLKGGSEGDRLQMAPWLIVEILRIALECVSFVLWLVVQLNLKINSKHLILKSLLAGGAIIVQIYLWVAVFNFGKSPPVGAKKNNGNVV